MTIRKNAILFLSRGCGLGSMPVAPGTFGTLAGLPICFLLSRLPLVASLAIVIIVILAAIWIAGESERILKQKDPGSIVIDEIGGMIVSLTGLPFTVLNAGIGFVLFRILDIAKPVPIRTIERRLSGGTGIVMDDIVAGLMVNITLRIVSYLINNI